MVNYNNSKIYKIVNSGDDICFVGSTTKQYLSQRMTFHVSAFKKGDATTTCGLLEKYGVTNCRIELLELFSCSSKDELDRKVSEYISALNCVNKVAKDVVESVVVESDYPSDEYLINLRKEYMKYEKGYIRIDKVLRWNENNVNVDMDFYRRKWERNMVYLTVDIRDAMLPIK